MFLAKTLLGLGTLAALPCFAEDLAVTAVRFWSLGEVTRVAIEATGTFEYRSDRIENPDRVFFDLLGARPLLPTGRRGMHVIPVGDGRIKQIRVAETQPEVTRVVLDLEAGVEFTASQLANPDRLMVEVRSLKGAPATPPVAVPPAPAVSKAPPKQFVWKQQTETAAARPASLTAPPRLEPRVQRSAAPRVALATSPITVPPPEPPPPAAAVTKPNPAPGPAHAKDAVALPAKRNSSGDRSLTRVLGLKVGRIVLDPGHGGHDTGTIGPKGLAEKDLVLDIAKRLGALIEARMGSEVIYTRTDDTFMPLEARTELANDLKADLFLSIHANSSPLVSASGVETYYLNFTTSRADLEVAARENASSEKTVHELKDLLAKIALKDKVDESKELAVRLQNSLFSVVAKNNARARNRGVKKAPFVVLIGASMPSVLTEIGFVSNPREEVLLNRADHRQRLAEALYKGVSQYLGGLSHFQVAQRQ